MVFTVCPLSPCCITLKDHLAMMVNLTVSMTYWITGVFKYYFLEGGNRTVQERARSVMCSEERVCVWSLSFDVWKIYQHVSNTRWIEKHKGQHHEWFHLLQTVRLKRLNDLSYFHRISHLADLKWRLFSCLFNHLNVLLVHSVFQSNQAVIVIRSFMTSPFTDDIFMGPGLSTSCNSEKQYFYYR